jgi:hypothetical protein
MVKNVMVDNTTTTQLEVFFSKENTIRLFLSDSEDPTDYYSSQYIDLDSEDTDWLISELLELKNNFLKSTLR